MNLEDLKLVDVERLEVKPGEALVLKYHGRLSENAAQHIRAIAEQVFALLKIPILVLDESIEPIVVAAGTGAPVRKVAYPPMPAYLAEDILPLDELHAQNRDLWDAVGNPIVANG